MACCWSYSVGTLLATAVLRAYSSTGISFTSWRAREICLCRAQAPQLLINGTETRKLRYLARQAPQSQHPQHQI